MRKILVVDDEHLIADTLSRILGHSGYDATPVYCAEEALQYMSSDTPDVLICDVILPGVMSGIDVAVHCRRTHPKCAVLLFSGNASTSDVLDEAVLRGEHFEILAKPMPPREMLKRVERALQSKRANCGEANVVLFKAAVGQS